MRSNYLRIRGRNGQHSFALLQHVPLTSVAAAVMAALHGASALAGNAPTSDTRSSTLQEVVVTATRRAVKAVDVPFDITAISGSSLLQNGIQNMAGLANSLAGVNYTDKGPYGSTTNSTIIIRGLNSEDTSDLAFPTPIVSPVAIYVDDTPLFANIHLQDIERVEILRGPQGTLYGSGSLGGTVRFIQNPPNPTAFDATVQIGVSDTYHTHAPNGEASGILNIPLSQTAAVRVNAYYTRDAGFINQPNLYLLDQSGVPVPQTPGDLFSPPKTYSATGVNTYSDKGARVALLWKPNESFQGTLSYFHQEDTGGGYPYSSPVYGVNSLSSVDVLREPTVDKIDLAAMTLKGDLGFASLSSVTSWTHHENVTEDDGTAVYQSFSFYTPYYGGNPRAVFPRYGGLDDKSWSEELHLVSKTGGPIDWVAGAFYRDDRTFIEDHEFAPGYNAFYNACAPLYGPGSSQCGVGEYGPINGVTEVDGIPLVLDQSYIGDFHTTFKDAALYGQLTWHITDKWSLTGGSRVFDETVSQSQQTALLFDGPTFAANQSISARWRRALWMINTSFKLNSANLVYATWSQGFRRGGVNALPPTEPVNNYVTPPSLTRLNPDTADNYEVGIKGTVAQRLRYSFSLYDIRWYHVQEGAQLTPLILPGAVNVGNANSRGIETEVTALLTSHLTADLNYTYDQTKLTSYDPLALIGLTIPPPPIGSPLPGTPKNSAAVRLTYSRIPLASGQLALSADAHYQSALLPSFSSTIPTVSGYTIFGARATYDIGHWTAALYVDNLTNRLGIDSYTDPGSYGYRYSAIISRPRTVGFTLKYSLL